MELEKYVLGLLKVARQEKSEITATKLQKIFFLLEREGGIDLGLGFEPYLFGPFSMRLAQERDRLIREGKIKEKVKSEVRDPFSNILVGHVKIYVLAKGIRVRVPKDAGPFFREWVKKSREEILKYVYTKYPTFSRYEYVREHMMKKFYGDI